MESIRRTILAVLLVMGLLAGFGSISEASPILFEIQISDGIHDSITIQDNLVGVDLDSRPGLIVWSGSLGDWTVVTQIAQTYDILGTPMAPEIDLNSTNLSAKGGTLTIDVSAVGFIAPASGFVPVQVAIGGTTLANGNSTVTAQLFGGTSNTLLDTSNLIIGTGALAGDSHGVFGGSADGSFAPTLGTYSLTSEVTLHHNVAGLTTFDVDSKAVPEPFTLVFLGACLLGAGMASRKFKM